MYCRLIGSYSLTMSLSVYMRPGYILLHEWKTIMVINNKSTHPACMYISHAALFWLVVLIKHAIFNRMMQWCTLGHGGHSVRRPSYHTRLKETLLYFASNATTLWLHHSLHYMWLASYTVPIIFVHTVNQKYYCKITRMTVRSKALALAVISCNEDFVLFYRKIAIFL